MKLRVLYSIVFLWFLAHSAAALGRIVARPSDVLNSGNTIVAGLGKEVINSIPTAQELLRAPKQILFGLPEVAVFQVIHNLCSLYMDAGTINPRIRPDSESMAFILRTPCKNVSISLANAEEVLESPHFDVNKKLAIFVSGWISTPEQDYITNMANAFNCRGDYNFMVLDSSDFIRTLYTWSAYNTEEIGRLVAKALAKLTDKVPVENIHLIGHSLGAHIVGYAGHFFTEYTGLNLTRITGLDPANPCFNEGQALSGLQRGNAEFIDIVHTNPGAFGKKNPVGDVDFYAEGFAPIKPGCSRLGCSHERAIQYFIETVYPENEQNFLGVRCTSLTALSHGQCNGPQYPMGLAVPQNLKGNYFLHVNANSPYGQNNNDQAIPSSECGKCVAK